MNFILRPAASRGTLTLALAYLGAGLLMGAFLPLRACAQETSGQLSGSIADKNRYPLAGVVVTMKFVPTGINYSTVTNAKGTYNVVNLRQDGPY